MESLREAQSRVREIYLARTTRSRALHERARALLPGGDTRTGTFFAPYPPFIARGRGERIHDVDGNEYVDFLNNFTSLVHGHAHPEVLRAAAEQMERGTAHAAPLEAQLTLAGRLQARIPSLHRVRFTNSGTEAVMQALRGARAFTGRALVLKMEGAYHGTYDGTEVGVDPGAAAPPWPRGEPDVPGLMQGTPDQVLVAPFNDLTTTGRIVEQHAAELAAVIVEGVMHGGGTIPAERDFLAGLRQLTRELGVLLVLDEIVTFRLSRGGAQEIHGVTPDLTVLGKTIGGGFPIGAVGGRADVMERFDPAHPRRIAHSGTYNGNPVSMAAGTAALDLLTAERIRRIDELGERLALGFQQALDRAGVAARVTRAGSLVQIHFTGGPVRDYRSAARGSKSACSLVHLALMNRGVFCGSRLNFNTSTAMSGEAVDHAVQALNDVVDELGAVLAQVTLSSSRSPLGGLPVRGS